MFIHHRKGWEIPSSEETPEQVFLNRRTFMGATASLGLSTALSGLASSMAEAAGEVDASASLYPAKRNEGYVLDREITAEAVTSKYNNFYEYGTSKDIYAAAQALKIRPWMVKLDGLVEKPQDFAIDDLIKALPLEERLYRHRCVEAWGMAVPWTGFSLKSLVDLAKPLSGAKYVRFETFMDPKMAPGQRAPFYPWPYVEGLTMAEATHDLAFMATGVYGKPLAKQFGSPLRLAVPWKYGFKSIKSIVKISFVAERPIGLWEAIQSSEYGFWANVNPEVSHPRWSQASEEILGKGSRRTTLLFNGYAEQVAGLYKGLEKERLYA